MTKAEIATEKRFDSVNEFRRTLSDQAATFASAERVDALQQRVDRMEGSSKGASALWGYAIGAIGGIAGAAAIAGAIAAFLK